MSDLDNTVDDIASSRASMTRTRPTHNPRAPLVPTSFGGGIVWLLDTKRCPSLPTLKVRHGNSNCIVPKTLSSLQPLARPSLPQARIKLHRAQIRYSAMSAMELLLD